MTEASASEKLELFSKTVFKEASEQVNKMIREAQKVRDERILGASDKYLALAEKRIESEKQRIENEYVKLAAADSIAASKQILLLRSELIDRVFDKVEEMLSRYRKTPEYPERLLMLCEKAAKQFDGAAATVLLSKADISLAQGILEKLPHGYGVEEDKTIKLGGVKLKFESEDVLFDYSFDSAVALSRENFTHEDKLRLHG